MPPATDPTKHRGQKPRKNNSITGIILPRASAPDQAQNHNSLTISHKPLCERLLPRARGWERLFLKEMAKLSKIGAIQRRKIEEIQRRHEQKQAMERICRHCQRKARILDEFSYFCRNCGNCLSLEWGGEQ
jgi:hypothetical protein